MEEVGFRGGKARRGESERSFGGQSEVQCLEGRGKQGGRVVLTRECDRKETGERNCQEWRREERVGNEGVLVD